MGFLDNHVSRGRGQQPTEFDEVMTKFHPETPPHHIDPDPVPVMLLARLAVYFDWQGRGLGASLLQDAVARTLQAADIAGIRAMLVHALSPEVAQFYRYFGFQATGSEPRTRMATLSSLESAIQ
jgi:GNAT superfamily N-acetyltransferase